MKIAGYQLDNTLYRGVKPAYLLSGDDAFLRYEALFAIQQAGKKNGFRETIKWSYLEDHEDESLANILLTQSLFQEKQSIELDFGDKFPTTAQQKILEEALKNPSTDKLIIIQTKKLDDKTQKSA